MTFQVFQDTCEPWVASSTLWSLESQVILNKALNQLYLKISELFSEKFNTSSPEGGLPWHPVTLGGPEALVAQSRPKIKDFKLVLINMGP